MFEPGSRMSYSNTGYILLGRVIEVVSHQAYRDYVREHLLDRAGMAHTHTVAEEPRLPNMAIGYRIRNGAVERAPTIHETVGWSAGNLVSTVDDLASWSRAFAEGGIVSARSYREMTTAARVPGGTSDYALGLFADSFRDQPRIGHTGGSFGFTTPDEYFPRQSIRLIAFTNLAANPEPGEIITKAVFDDLFPQIAAASDRPAPHESAERRTKVKAFFERMQHARINLPHWRGNSQRRCRWLREDRDGLIR